MTEYPQRNLLANALSPYLLQHKDNPVHWRQWRPEALAEARECNKPILLSIGYAACHWCHVMAHESFENPEIAALMNRQFVNIKVDREERPDVDQVYMAALRAMGEQGGWPLTMFLTPDGTPFWGGTYFPPVSRYGRPGFSDVLTAIAELYRSDPDHVARNAAAVKAHLRRSLQTDTIPGNPTTHDVDAVADRLLAAIDPINGGIGGAPKFPSMTMWECLWRASVRRHDHRFRTAALDWARALCNGGIYDHLGGGLHRYSVDERWLVPHFEKMLYDNAQFIRTLCLCYRATDEKLFRARIEETIHFLLVDMRLPEDGFASSLDADSEGEEGRFYVWTRPEIETILGQAADEFCSAYDVRSEGNWDGKSILNRLSTSDNGDAAKHQFLSRCRERLLSYRNRRIPPSLDDKVLTDWNGLVIRALVDAGTLLDRPDWIDAADATFNFVIDRAVTEDGSLAHAWRKGRVSGPALATDLATMIEAAIALYGARFDDRYLAVATSFAENLQTAHDDGSGGYFLASSASRDLSMRSRNDDDEATPSATAMIISAFGRLALVGNDSTCSAKADRALAAAWGRVKTNPFRSVGIVNAADDLQRATKLVTTSESGDFAEIIRRHPDPARIDLCAPDIEVARKLIGDTTASVTTRAAAYLCRGMACRPPVFEPRDLVTLLENSEKQ